MPRRKPGSKKQHRGPDQLRPRMIFVRTTVAQHDAAKEVAARLKVKLSALAEEALARLVELHSPDHPRPFVAQTTVVLHDAAKEAAARLKMSLNEFLEDALLSAVERHNQGSR